TAISAVANGGNLVTPYVVEKVINSQGEIVSSHEADVRRNIISEEVAETVSKILIDGVNGDGGAKNAGVAGYDIAAKTGTSQKFDILDENGNSYLRIGSTVAYSVDCDRGISAIIVVDEPTSNVKYGSVVAAPYISCLMEKILPYLEYKSNSEEINITVSDYVGMSVSAAKEMLKKQGLPYEIVGSGSVVMRQTPSGGDTITMALSKIILYTDVSTPTDIAVPSLLGMTLSDAIKTALGCGLNIKLSGASPGAKDIVTEQSLPPDMMTKIGSVIIIRAIENDFED
ncbi:MAG: PASTA domain-containing protein, partial [Clostridia bacterium]|nr:PASTA domain-containing protein [Clostridia bacterium]